MSNARLLSQLRQQMESLKSEYAAISEAYKLLSQSKSGRGRKPSLDFLSAIESGQVVRRTGKRGRPPGAKNKPGYKKPGPKPGQVKAAAKSVVAKKRGRKPSSK